MFVPDDRLASLIFAYCRERLALDPVALDFPGEKAVLDKALAGLFDASPRIRPAYSSCSPRSWRPR